MGMDIMGQLKGLLDDPQVVEQLQGLLPEGTDIGELLQDPGKLLDTLKDSPDLLNKLQELVPDDFAQTYDMHDVIKVLVDEGDYLEIKDEYAQCLITCFGRFNGEVVGLVASNPAYPGSILDVNACDKYYRFLQVLDAYNIPLVNLVDTPPVVPGEAEESRGLLRHIGKIADVYATTTVPKISVILREAYADTGCMIMGIPRSMGSDLIYAWPLSRLAVEASELDYRRIYNQGIEEDAYEAYLNRSREKIDVFEAGYTWTAQVVDEIILPQDTRRRIIEALAVTRNKQEKLPRRAKIHTAPPT